MIAKFRRALMRGLQAGDINQGISCSFNGSGRVVAAWVDAAAASRYCPGNLPRIPG